MRIDSVVVRLPERVVGNAEILDLVREHSRVNSGVNLDAITNRVARLLRHSGAHERRWLASNEQPIGLLTGAVEAAFESANCSPEEIDLLVYAGVDRGFAEPGDACFVAQALGMQRVQCFDIVDGCNAWSRALYLVQALMAGGLVRRALVVNGEFPMRAGGCVLPGLFRVIDEDQLAWCYAAYTLGECATATVLSASAGGPWIFRFGARNDLAELCTVPLDGFERRLKPSSINRVARSIMQARRFTSFGATLFDAAVPEMMRVIADLQMEFKCVDMVLPHSASESAWRTGLAGSPLGDRIYSIFPRLGNVAAASIPAGMALAVSDGTLLRGQRILALSPSAGMSFAAYTFVY